MDKEERNVIYRKAEEIWGLVAQYDQAVEEMAELIVAINKYKRKCLYGEYKSDPKIEENLIEELADVKMCMEQLWGYVGEDKVDEVLDRKFEKLKNLIDVMTESKKEN